MLVEHVFSKEETSLCRSASHVTMSAAAHAQTNTFGGCCCRRLHTVTAALPSAQVKLQHAVERGWSPWMASVHTTVHTNGAAGVFHTVRGRLNKYQYSDACFVTWTKQLLLRHDNHAGKMLNGQLQGCRSVKFGEMHMNALSCHHRFTRSNSSIFTSIPHRYVRKFRVHKNDFLQKICVLKSEHPVR